ncbi:MAG: DUF4339 domain-containing protein [Pirellulales bacterium]
MGIKFYCPSGHRLHVKESLAGRRGVCPHCGERVIIPVPQAVQDTSTHRVSSNFGNGSAAGPAAEGEAPRSQEAQAHVADSPAEKSAEATSTQPQSVRLAWSRDQIVMSDHVTPAPGGQSEPDAFTAPVSPGDGEAPLDPRTASTALGEDPATTTCDAAWPAPLEEAPAARWYVRLSGGERFGPARADVMAKWLRDGRVPKDAWLWREGWADWKPAGDVFAGQRAVDVSYPTDSAAQLSTASAANHHPTGAARTAEPIEEKPFTLRDAGDERMRRLVHQQRAGHRGLLVVALLTVVTIVLFSVLLYVLLRPPSRGASAEPQAKLERAAVEAEPLAGLARPVG